MWRVKMIHNGDEVKLQTGATCSHEDQCFQYNTLRPIFTSTNGYVRPSGYLLVIKIFKL